jgi:hypothetical protein
MQSLTNVSAVGNGTPLPLNGLRRCHTMVVVPIGTLTAGVVTLQGSLDGNNWAALPGGATAALSGTVSAFVESL